MVRRSFDSLTFAQDDIHFSLFILHFIPGDVLVSTGVVRLDKRAVAPDHDKTGIFINLTDNYPVAIAA